MREQILERLRWAYKHSPRVVRKTLRPFRDIGADCDLALRAGGRFPFAKGSGPLNHGRRRREKSQKYGNNTHESEIRKRN
jgi:hypothetical protein